MTSILHLFDNIGEGAFVVDSRQRVVYWNSVATELLGYEAQDALGHHCWELLHGRTSGGARFCRDDCGVLSRSETGEPIQHFDVHFTHRDGHQVLFNISTLPIPAAQRTMDESMVHLLRCRNEPGRVSHQLRVAMLGPLRVWRPDGSVVSGSDWRRTKVRALLALLVLARGQPVEREVLVDQLWPEMAYEAALRNLNTTVYQLRRVLEPDLKKPSESSLIHYVAGAYHMDATRMVLDVTGFENLLSRARRQQNGQEAIRLYNAGCALYEGEYLADLTATAVWNSGESTRLQGLYLNALETLGRLYEAQGDMEHAEAAYLRALATDPCRETATQKLMQMLLKTGDCAGAATHCLRLLDNLRGELGMETSPETQALCRRAGCAGGAGF